MSVTKPRKKPSSYSSNSVPEDVASYDPNAVPEDVKKHHQPYRLYRDKVRQQRRRKSEKGIKSPFDNVDDDPLKKPRNALI